MNTQAAQIARDACRISTFHPDFGIRFNQFLIADKEPFVLEEVLDKRET